MHRYPSEWRTVSLRDTGRWLSGGTPNTSFPRYWDGDIPWISAASLKEFKITDSDRKVSQLGASSGTRIVPRNTVLFVVRGMSLKTEFRIGITQREVAFGQDCKAILPAPEIDPPFLAHCLKANSGRVLAIVDEAGHGTGRLPTDQLEALTIGVPRLNEQRRIAEILDSMDESIRSTELLIAKLETEQRAAVEFRLEAIAETNHERAARHALSECCHRITDGTHQAVRTVSGDIEAVPFLYVSCIRKGRINWSEAAAVSRREYQMIKRGREPVAGMVLYTTVGSYGHAAAVRTVRDFAFQRHIACIYPNRRIVSPDFLTLWLNSDRMRRYADRVAVGNAQKTVTLGALMGYPFPAAAIEKQSEVANIDALYSSRLDSERSTLEKLSLVKLGLQNDLLTGRVRVRVDQEAAA